MSTIPTSTTFGSAERPGITLVDLANRFGEIPPERICLSPPPGEATEADLLQYSDHDNRLFELVDGTLIEKTMGNFESIVAGHIHAAIYIYLQTHPLGVVLPADGQLRLKPGTIRVPDVSYISRERAQKCGFLKSRIASLTPNIAVEVISYWNSVREMNDKLQEYFATGAEEVWYVYPAERTVHQYTALNSRLILTEVDSLVTPRLLPEFELPIRSIFIDPLANDALASDPRAKG